MRIDWNLLRKWRNWFPLRQQLLIQIQLLYWRLDWRRLNLQMCVDRQRFEKGRRGFPFRQQLVIEIQSLLGNFDRWFFNANFRFGFLWSRGRRYTNGGTPGG